MRIVGSQIQQVVGSYLKQAKKAEAPDAPTGVSDEVSVSDRAADVAKARQAYDALPDVREDVVAELKARIDNDTYRLQEEQIANAILRGQSPG